MSIMAKTPSGYKKIGSAYLGERPVDKVFNANGDVVYARQRELTGVPPLLFKGKEQSVLQNYRIYGDTVDGNSVGNLVESGEHAGEYEVPVTVEGKNLCNNIWEQGWISNTGNIVPHTGMVCCDFIPVKPNVTYSCSRTIANDYNNLRCYETNKNYLGTGADLANKDTPLKQGELFGTFMITDARVSYIRFNDGSNSLDTKYMIVEGAYTAETMPSYEPYHAPVTTPIYLPEPIKMVGDEAEYIDYAEQKLHRVRKNLLPNTATSKTVNGVTFTINSDASVTCNGTASALSILYLVGSYYRLLNGVYKFTGCPANGSGTTFCQDLYSSSITLKRDYGEGVKFEVTANDIIAVRLIIFAGYTCDNLTFYPTIRKADIEDDTYEPYIENTDLDVTLPALPTLKGTNTMSVDTEVQPSRMDIEGRIKTLT